MKKMKVHGISLFLFAIAFAFYLMGLFSGAGLFSALGIAVEVGAWISLFSSERK